MARWLLLIVIVALALSCGGSDKDSITEGSPPGRTPEASPSTGAPLPSLPAVTSENRIRIPSIGVDAPITFKPVPSSGNLPDPDGSDDVALYDFSQSFAQYGGVPGSGNAVLFGKPDSAQSCKNGTVKPPCEAVFWNLRRMKTGEQIVVDWESHRHVFTVVAVCTMARAEFKDDILRLSSFATATLMTAGGQFDLDRGQYSHFVFVRAEAQAGSVERNCPSGTTTLPPPSPSPTPSPKADVTIVSAPETARIGQPMRVQAQTTQGANCAVRLLTSEGKGEFGARYDVRDPSGAMDVTFIVRPTVTPGEKQLEVDCGGRTDSRPLLVSA